MGIQEKIKEIEFEMSRTQKNKATEYHLGLLKAKLAKLRTQLLEPAKGVSCHQPCAHAPPICRVIFPSLAARALPMHVHSNGCVQSSSTGEGAGPIRRNARHRRPQIRPHAPALGLVRIAQISRLCMCGTFASPAQLGSTSRNLGMRALR
jgi:hypothetical protein